MKVLIGVDGSQGSFAAVQQAGTLLSPERDQVVAYYLPPTIHLEGGPSGDAKVMSAVTESLVKAVFDEARQLLPPALQAKTELKIGQGRAADDLLAAADSAGAELIVVGARGLGAMQALLLGSVSRAVVHGASVPVLVCRPRRAGSETSPPRVLVALQCEAADAPLAAIAAKLTWPAGTVGLSATVIEPLFAGAIPAWLADPQRSPEVEAMAAAWREEHERERRDQQTALVRFAETLPSPFQTSEPLVLEGHAGEQLVEAARQQQVDLIIVGARPCGPMARLLLGSTSDTVLNHAPCSVLVTPKK